MGTAPEGEGVVLVADVGGTNTRVALWRGGLEQVRTWATAETPSLRSMVDRYRTLVPAASVAAACVAVAGPVEHRRARLTNTTWSGTEHDLDVPLRLVNDLYAAAAGLNALGPDDLVPLGGPGPDPTAPRVVMGIGTGLGEALRLGDLVVPGEGGHASVAPADAEQDELVAWLRQRCPAQPVRWEDVISGPGLATLLAFVRRRTPVSEVVAKALAVEDPQQVVTAWAGRDPACTEAAALLVRLCASEARNQALRVLAYGGVYLAGGLPPRLLPFFQDPALFREPFEHGGPMQDRLARVPVFLVTHPQLALLGAAMVASRLVAAPTA